MKAKFNTPVSNLTATERLRLAAKREQHRTTLEANREFRYGQVLAVRALQASGVSAPEALKRVGISRAGFCDWGLKLSAKFKAEEL